MHCEDSFVSFSIWLICFANYFLVPKEILELSRSVRGFLWWGQEEGGVAKAFPSRTFVGGAAIFHWEGRASAKQKSQHRDFDDTKGYPGDTLNLVLQTTLSHDRSVFKSAQ